LKLPAFTNSDMVTVSNRCYL